MIAQYYGISLISKIIRWRTYGDVSHTAWVSPHSGRVIEAWQQGGVRELDDLNCGHTPGTVIDLYRVEGMTRDKHRAIEDFLRRQVGKKYAFWQILRFITRQADLLRADLLRECPCNLRSWFCSELVFTALRLQGLWLLNAPANRVHPTLLGYSPLLIPYGRWIVGATKTLSEAAESICEVGRPYTRKNRVRKNADLCNQNAEHFCGMVPAQMRPDGEIGQIRPEIGLKTPLSERLI